MTRDLTLFPEDNIGNTLWDKQEAGEDLTQLREIEFSVLFVDQVQALKYGQLLLENNQKLSFSPYQDKPETPWEITAYPEMAPTHENISAYLHLLTSSAEPLNGQFDAWYF